LPRRSLPPLSMARAATAGTTRGRSARPASRWI
jgi:hypothetical protein